MSLSGSTRVRVGGGSIYVNPPASVSDLPSGLVTTTSAFPTVPGGTSTVSSVGDTKITFDAALPPIATVAPS